MCLSQRKGGLAGGRKTVLLGLLTYFCKIMILPIVAYGAPILRVVSKDITPDYPALPKLISDMWETMYSSNGVGLAAPQINRDIRLFVVDSQQIFEKLEEEEQGKYHA